MSIDETFFPYYKTNIEDKIRDVSDVVSSYRTNGRAVCAHAFSNGGAMLMMSVLKRTDTEFDASVYDSAPSSWISPIASPIVIASSGDSTPVRTILKHLPYSTYSTLRSVIKRPLKPFGDFFELKNPNINTPRPEMYIYSDADRIINANAVEQFADYRESVGCHTTSKLKLRNSPHCQHYRMHPEMYETSVESFLREAGLY